MNGSKPPMWKTVHQSVQGTSHRAAGLACQDSSAVREIELAGETVLVAACSDGAGSAELSHVGSEVACQTLVNLVAAEARAFGAPAAIDFEHAAGWVAEVHRALGRVADQQDVELRQLACTLLFAVVTSRGTAFGQIGDGAIVVSRAGAYQAVFWPQSGEYVNTTNFISDPRWPSNFEFAWREGPVDELALLSDGLQMLALDYRAKGPHGPFFAPMFQALRNEADPAKLTEPLRAFLDSPAVAERTDDDKTLILATRLEPLTPC
jgi:hypothetical protein